MLNCMMMREVIKPPNMEYPGVEAFFTTKVSGDKGTLVHMEVSGRQKVYLPIQRHTDRVIVLGEDVKPEVGDAVITNRRDVLVGVQTADCVPIIVFDSMRMVVGAVHAGWRGTAAQILKKTLMAMSSEFHSAAGDISIAIGPSIRSCCYEVGADVHNAVSSSTGDGDFASESGSQFFVDLALANMLQAISLGVVRERIWISEECTFCNPDRFHSYRYHGDHAGRQGAFIGCFDDE